jgi:hypothetical protein
MSANFHMMIRVADGTGTPLDEFAETPTKALRSELGPDGFASARHVTNP